jgi:hypothetical protein
MGTRNVKKDAKVIRTLSVGVIVVSVVAVVAFLLLFAWFIRLLLAGFVHL